MASTLKRLAPRLWLLLLLLALGIGLALIEQRNSLLSPTFSPDSSGGEPDYYLEGVDYTRFDAQGRAYQTLTSPRIAHTPQDDITRARQPSVTLLGSDGQRWHATGDEAVLGANADTLTLSGNATLFEPSEQWRLETEVLHYDRRDSHAWSDTDSRFFRGDQRTRGDRFDAWIDQNRVEIEGQVRGYHPPAQ